jgi:hypothetical protein
MGNISGKKYGGRKKGTPNKASKELREDLEKLGLDVPKAIVELLPYLDYAEKAQTLLGLLPYIYPKLKAIEHSMDKNSVNTFTDFIKSISVKK